MFPDHDHLTGAIHVAEMPNTSVSRRKPTSRYDKALPADIEFSRLKAATRQSLKGSLTQV